MGIVSWTAQAMGAPLFGLLLIAVLLAVAFWPQRRQQPPSDARSSVDTPIAGPRAGDAD